MADTTMTITIHVYNDAEVSPRILVEAKRIAAKAFRDAGVETRWLDEDPSRDQGYKARPFRSLDMAVRIAAHFMAQSLDQPDDALGVAPGSGPNRHLTYVFYGRAEQLARQSKAEQMRQALVGRFFYPSPNIEQLLGHAMAHELGHLLGLDGHSATGIMRADWNLADLRSTMYGDLAFTQPQGEIIRAEVRRRIAAGGMPRQSGLNTYFE